MRSVLFIMAHPFPRQSRANASIFEIVSELPFVTPFDLYEAYPNFHIDVEAQKKLLSEHDSIVLQHPLYWYNMPPLLKLWMDDVLQLGFAYGPNGTALKGKQLLVSITCSGDKLAYSETGFHGLPVETFLASYKQTALLCGMKYLQPKVLYGATKASQRDIQKHALQLCADLELLKTTKESI